MTRTPTALAVALLALAAACTSSDAERREDQAAALSALAAATQSPAGRAAAPTPSPVPTPAPAQPASPTAVPAGAVPAGGDPFSALLLRAADADGRSGVSAAEWQAMVARASVHSDASMDPTDLLALVLAALLDADHDARFTGRDVERALASLDVDGSGTIEAQELLAPPDPGGGRVARNLVPSVIGMGADTSGDGVLDHAEWLAATGGPDGVEVTVPLDRIAAWIDRAGRQSPEGVQDFGPATLLLSLRSALDATHDGRFDRADLDRLRAEADTNGDGALDSEELARRGGPGAGTPWVEAEPPAAAGPPLMPWQRTLQDALALSRQTGKPLLVCVNVDGEAASETFAAGRYRDPAFVQLATGFIPVLASPDLRTPRDHDDRGRRIADPKFGRVIDAELIDIEPALFERWFHGERVAPRHVGVAPDGTILFDLYLLTDLSVVDRALAEHGHPGALPDPAAMDEAQLLADPDATARARLEERWAHAAPEVRERLARAALDPARETQHPELLRLALRDEEAEVRRAAALALAAHAELVPSALLAQLLPDALGEAMAEASADAEGAATGRALADGLLRLAASAGADDATRALALRAGRVLTGAAARSTLVDTAAWTAALERAPTSRPASAAAAQDAPADEQAAYALVGALDEQLARAPDDDGVRLRLAEANLRAGVLLRQSGARDASFLLADSQQAARQVAVRQPGNGAAWAVFAASSVQIEDWPAAADAAARALPLLLADAGNPLAVDALDALVQARSRALAEAFDAGTEWPPEWLADVAAACEVLVGHRRASEAQVVSALNAVGNFDLYAAQRRLARRALQRFPDAPPMHAYFRWQVLRDAGATALSAEYEAFAPAGSASPMALWFSGLANLAAAERHRENREPDEAAASYARAAARWRRSVELNPDFSNSLDYVAQAEAGAAAVALERGELGAAAAALRESVLASVAGFESADGLGITPAQTAAKLLAALRAAERGEEADALATLMAEHDVAVEERAAGR